MIQNGNEDTAIKYLYQKIWPTVLSWIKKNNGNKEEAQDIFQDAIVVLYKQIKMHKYDQKYEIQAYMFSICKNLWINFIKRKNKSEEISENQHSIQDNFNALSNLINAERENYILQVFAQLGERCKELLILSFYNNYSTKEIAEKMGFGTEEVAKTKKYKCKQRLIAIVGERDDFKGIIG